MQINPLGAKNTAAQFSRVQTKPVGDFAAALKSASAPADSGQDAAKLKTVCQDMEAVFLNLLLSKMRDTVPENTLMGNSSAEKMIQSMLDGEITKDMAKAGGMGLADMLYRQLAPAVGVENKSQAR